MGANPEAIWATGTGARATRHSPPIFGDLSPDLSFFPSCKYDSRPARVGWNLAQSLRWTRTRRTLESCAASSETSLCFAASIPRVFSGTIGSHL
ncbi:hypothetical protein HU200_029589 [Digitaria exilis]|uniref:Uncharacterized protein n=1 Tax=Digitaria exilis TaxID=1010633 RepID=A0A835BPV8_9POAL|nr:hypothetical protein HU200_029589 [Digitaria exilis]